MPRPAVEDCEFRRKRAGYSDGKRATHSDGEAGHRSDLKRAAVPTRSGPPFQWQAGRAGGDIWETCLGQQLRQKPRPLNTDGGADACQEIADHETVTAYFAP